MAVKRVVFFLVFTLVCATSFGFPESFFGAGFSILGEVKNKLYPNKKCDRKFCVNVILSDRPNRLLGCEFKGFCKRSIYG